MTPKLPEPWDYAYEWDGPFGSRKLSAAQHNGRKPDRSVPVYTADQMREMWKQGMERAAEICDDLADWHQLIRDSRGESIVNNCSDAIRKETWEVLRVTYALDNADGQRERAIRANVDVTRAP